MTRRERLMATLQGKPVDRPAVSFYELNGFDEHPDDPDPFNIFSHPSWQPLLELAREKTDRIVMRGVAFKAIAPDPIGHLAKDETWLEDGARPIRRLIADRLEDAIAKMIIEGSVKNGDKIAAAALLGFVS